MPKPSPPRRGRPRREGSTPTLQTLAFRPAPDTRKLVEEGAQSSGLSLSAEIDRRLRQAYWDKGRHRSECERAFGGQHNFTLAFLLARVATGVEHACGASWRENSLVWREVATALVALLQLMRGLGGGTVALPVRVDGRPNPAWDVENQSRSARQADATTSGDPHWFRVLHVVNTILSTAVPPHWPLVDTIKTSHGDFRDDMIPAADELKRLYAQTVVTTATDVRNQLELTVSPDLLFGSRRLG